ncbi:MAG: gpW family head-tail joining protein [Pseudomonadota bacterium]
MNVSNTIVIGGETVDINKPCEVVTSLRKAQLKLATGGAEIEIEIDGERVRYANPNQTALVNLIAQYSQACDAESGGNRSRRRQVIWRP